MIPFCSTGAALRKLIDEDGVFPGMTMMKISWNYDTKQTFCWLTLLMILVITGCEPHRIAPPRGVERENRDLSSLVGRKIVIDPGHGGRFPGAVGPRGLRECDVNLAVALHLWGLLTQARAQVWLTRTADMDLSGPGGGLKEDLNARARLSTDVQADIFISIHHNSNIYDRKKNNLQVYYRLADVGPSEDLASSLAGELGKELPEGEIFVLPGNYRVLRNAQCTAVLGEASFISHKKNEDRLSLSNQVRREAEDYFMGILAYFQRGIPTIVNVRPTDAILDTAFPTLEATLIGGEAGCAIDPEAVLILLDGAPVTAHFVPQTGVIQYQPSAPLTNGPHSFRVLAANRNGNSARPATGSFIINRPVAQVSISSIFSELPLGDQVCSRITVSAADAHGLPIIDGTLLALHASAGRLEDTTITTKGGCGTTYFFPPDTATAVDLSAASGTVTGTTRVYCGASAANFVKLVIQDTNSKPVAAVRVATAAALQDVSDLCGFAFLRTESDAALKLRFEKRGYEPQNETVAVEPGRFRQQPIVMIPCAGGAFLDQRFTLDPEPWDGQTAAESDMTPAAEEANHAVALHLQQLLADAGAESTTTASCRDHTSSLRERILTGESFDGDFFITLAHRDRNPSVSYYFASPIGARAAKAIGKALEEYGGVRDVSVMEGTEFTIIQPSAPAVVVNLGDSSLPADHQAWKREAEAVYAGLRAFLSQR
ncbi:MAG TPA: N-acetylmuramoyl-L-alanine amidase [Thermodesulfobacteriota bacterium]|nr:N-acetylmuramoyl-L-alanine amidase [Thermodesulfobacteriota bacterium]HNU71423.1 N-acetylmuramoyl-L-alanine amidase [Thermodesulfobacteriota bacterium]